MNWFLCSKIPIKNQMAKECLKRCSAIMVLRVIKSNRDGTFDTHLARMWGNSYYLPLPMPSVNRCEHLEECKVWYLVKLKLHVLYDPASACVDLRKSYSRIQEVCAKLFITVLFIMPKILSVWQWGKKKLLPQTTAKNKWLN